MTSPRPAGSTRSKILSREAVARAARAARRRGERVVFTNGCFDLLHVGHVRIAGSKKLDLYAAIGADQFPGISRLNPAPVATSKNGTAHGKIKIKDVTAAIMECKINSRRQVKLRIK